MLLSIGAAAQTVTTVEGPIVTFTSPAPIEGSPGDLAKLCSDQVIAGKSTRVCSAMLRIKAVAGTRGTGELIKGDSSAVQIGMKVVIDRRAAAASGVGKGKRVNPDDPADQLRAGEEAFAGERWSEAVAHFERLLVLVPADPYAMRKLQEAREGERQAAFRAEVRARRQKEGAKVSYLESSLERSVAAGDLDAAGSYARMLLEIDPFDPQAIAVRESAREAVKASADPLAESWDWSGFQAAWDRFAEIWSDPAAKEQAAAESRARIEGVFSAWSGQSCREFPRLFAAIGESLRREPLFLDFTEERIRSGGCRLVGRLRAPGEGSSESAGALSAIVARGVPGPQSTTLQVSVGAAGTGRPGAEAEIELEGEAPVVVLVAGGSDVRVGARSGPKDKDRGDPRDSWMGTPPPGGEVVLCAESTSNPLRKVVGRRFHVQVCAGP